MESNERIHALLKQLYPTDAAAVHQQLMVRLQQVKVPPPAHGDYLSERTVTLITYGDSLQRNSEHPLVTLHRFLKDLIGTLINTIHILPFYPYSSDDGFSVIDYYAVNPEFGNWEDIRALSSDYRLMFDAVINHMSAQSPWFHAFLHQEEEYRNLFMTESPETDLSAVTRPRTSPLLTPFKTRSSGVNGDSTVHVWTTFSADQVDLDFRSPSTFMRILDVLLFYIEQGAQVIRLDAIAFLWKQAGTTSLHLPQTHAVIKLIRAALDVVAPHVYLISETNVPHQENISYFGEQGDEAQLVYNFTLPPLLIYTLLSSNANKLADWINTLPPSTSRTTFFNFTASHDGIGVRPVEGILEPDELTLLVKHVEQVGGRVSYRSQPDGSQTAYELNVTYVDAAGQSGIDEAAHIRRFLLTQGVMLALSGVPAVYIHSLLGTRNDYTGLETLGYNRAINRAKLNADQITETLHQPNTFRSKVFKGYKHLLDTRTGLKALHPQASQRAWIQNDGALLSLERISLDGEQTVTAIFNFSSTTQSYTSANSGVDVLTGEEFPTGQIQIDGYGMRWLKY
jgi:glucosylglycerate phosphorylase